MAKTPMDPTTRARMGGQARARSMSKRKRTQAARLAAMARWGKRPDSKRKGRVTP